MSAVRGFSVFVDSLREYGVPRGRHGKGRASPLGSKEKARLAERPELSRNPDPGEAPCEMARRAFGRIHIVNSEAQAYAYTNAAIHQAYRAVSEIEGA